MKSSSIFLFLLCSVKSAVYAQSWQPLGPEDNWASDGIGIGMSMAISPTDNMPYFSNADANANEQLTVKKFNGSVWENVGDAGFSAYRYVKNSLAVSPDGIPYIAYIIPANQTDINSEIITVKRFNGSIWEDFDPISAPHSNGFESSFVSLNFSPDGSLYIAHEHVEDFHKVTVQKHNGSAWEIVGEPGFTVQGDFFDYVAFDFSPAGIPYVAHIDSSNKLRVYQFNGTTWVTVGGNFVTEDRVKTVSMTFSTGGALAVSYQNLQNQNNTEIQQLIGATWTVINTTGLNAANFEDSFISYAPDGILYAVVKSNERILVKRYNGNTWENTGNDGFFITEGDPHVIAFSDNSVPHLLYQDGDNLNKATVVSLTNNVWDVLGTKGISAFYGSSSTVAISPDDEPYVAYIDDANQGKLTVQKHNGVSWEPVGKIGFTNTKVNYLSIAFSLDGLPYVTYVNTVSQKANVQRFNGVSWEFVGNPDFSDGAIAFTSIKFSPDGLPYVLYKDFSRIFGKATVRRFNGNTWELVGNGGFSEDEIDYPSMAFAPDGSLYVCYSLSDLGYDISVQKFDGNSWEALNKIGLFEGQSYHTSIAVSIDGVPHIAFENGSNGSLNAQFYNGTSWEYVGDRNYDTDNIRDATIGILADGSIYILYSGLSNGVRLRRFNNDNLELEGDSMISNVKANYPDLVEDSEGNLIVVYSSGYVYAKKYDASIPSNQPPEIIGDLIFYVEENTNPIINIQSIDPDGDTEGDGLTYTFTNQNEGGSDNSLFTLDNQNGEITFVAPPDFENPLDSDSNNEYTIQITVTDSDGLTDTENVLIIVTDVTEYQNDLSIIEIAIVNTADENDFIVLTNNMIVDAAVFCGKNWNLVAKPTSQVESVRLELSGTVNYQSTANNIPYFLFDETHENFNGELFENGNYSITATPYSSNNLMGDLGESLTINFEIQREESQNGIIIYPNPVTSRFNFRVSNCTEINEVLIFDVIGRLVSRLNAKTGNLGEVYEIPVPILASGVYHIMISDMVGKEKFVGQIVIK